MGEDGRGWERMGEDGRGREGGREAGRKTGMLAPGTVGFVWQPTQQDLRSSQ
jgi:hypothetical protein